MSDVKKFMAWMKGWDTGLSSEALGFHMMLGDSTGHWPSDPADLGRCLRLLDLFPEWETRILEMKRYGQEWKAYSENWAQLRQSMAEEVGVDWSKGKRAQKTYDLMRRLAER